MKIHKSFLLYGLIFSMAASTLTGDFVPPRPHKKNPEFLKKQMGLHSATKLNSLRKSGRNQLFRSGSGKSGESDLYVALLVQFAEDTNPLSTGNGHFQTVPAAPENVAHDQAFFRRMLDHLSAYYRTTSYGIFAPEFTLVDSVVTLPLEMKEYGKDDEPVKQACNLLRDTIKAFDPVVNFSEYRGVIVFHAGAGQESDLKNDSPDDIWSTFLTVYDLKENLGVENGIETDDGTFITQGAIIPETENQDIEPDGGVYALLGIMAHEFAQFLGLPVLYDTTPGDYPDSWGVGAWCIMGLGAWNAGGFCPPHFCAWSKMDLGWINVEEISVNTENAALFCVEEPDSINGLKTGSVIKIPISDGEYFLIENRLQDQNRDSCFTFANGTCETFDFFDPESEDSMLNAEFDFFLPGERDSLGRMVKEGSGLLIWHIDENVIENNRALNINRVNADPRHKGVDLEEADGIQDLDSYYGNWGSYLDSFRKNGKGERFAADTNPNSNSNSNAVTYISVENISPAGRVMRFDVKFKGMQEGFPVNVGEGHEFFTNSLNAGDVDGRSDGRKEIVAATRDSVLIVCDSRGKGLFDGVVFQIIKGETFSGTPALADLDDDSRTLEIIACSRQGSIYAFNGKDENPKDGHGDLVKGFPVKVTGEIFTPPVALDLKRGKGTEIAAASVSGDTSYIYVLNRDLGEGSAWKIQDGMPLKLKGIVYAPIAVTDSLGFGATTGASIVAGTVEGYLYCINVEEVRVEWVKSGVELMKSGPVIVDIDRDGRKEIIAASVSGSVYAYRETGMLLPGGWPVTFKGNIGSNPCVADIDKNGYPEIFITTQSPNELHRLQYYGGDIVDWIAPIIPQGSESLNSVFASPVIGDINGDGYEEVIVCDQQGIIRAYDKNGIVIQGFPIAGAKPKNSTPVLLDIDNDGDIEIGSASDDGKIEMWDLAAPFNADEISWGMFRGDPGLSGGIYRCRNFPKSESGRLFYESRYFNAPNPATGDFTDIYYWLKRKARFVEITVLDIRGEQVFKNKLIDELFLLSGDYSKYPWKIKQVANGVYICKIRALDEEGYEDEVFFKIGIMHK